MAKVVGALLTIVSCIDNPILQYLALGILILYATVHLATPLAPHARMEQLERLIQDTNSLFDKAREEHLLLDRHLRWTIRLHITRAQEEQSLLRSQMLQRYGLGRSYRQYLHLFGDLALKIRRCRDEVRTTQLSILSEMEKTRHSVHSEEAGEIMFMLASG